MFQMYVWRVCTRAARKNLNVAVLKNYHSHDHCLFSKWKRATCAERGVVHFRTSVTLTPTLTLEVRKCTSPCRDYTSMQYENADYQTSLLCLVYTLAFSLLYVGFAATEIRRDIYT